MPIQAINYNHPNNKPAFTGYVDKSVVKLLNKTVDEIGDFAVQEAKLTGKPANLDQYCNAIKTRENILNTLRSFMEKLHPNTALKYENGGGLFIKNKKLGVGFNFINRNRSDLFVDHNVIGVYNPQYHPSFDFSVTRLEELNTFSKSLNEIDSKILDKQTFKNYIDKACKKVSNISIFPETRIKRLGKQADKIAEEFNESGNWENKFTLIHKSAKKNNKN